VLRRVFLYILTILAGAAVFGGIAWLVSLVFPAAAFWVFWTLFAIWVWIGWRYASLSDEVRRREGRGIRQSDIWGDSKPPLSEEGKDERVPTSLNQRLDEMGPGYRAIFGRLTRVLAMIEHAASTKPPRMTPKQFEAAIDLLESSTAELKEAARESGEPPSR
jgi:hypothetical protein